MAKKIFYEQAKEDGINMKFVGVEPMDDEEFYDSRIVNIANNYGYEAQAMQCIEECAELIQAINKYRRYGDEAKDNLVEEIADVQIMLDQLLYLLNADTFSVIDKKLDRQIERVVGKSLNIKSEPLQ